MERARDRATKGGIARRWVLGMLGTLAISVPMAGRFALADTVPAALRVETPAGAMAVLKAGAGPAVVIVHGIGGHKEDWQGVMAALSGGHTVYALDMIGFGASAKTAPEITIDTQAAAVLALLDAEGIGRADLIGNSVGGWVTATFAASHPDRTGRVILVDPAGFAAMFDGESPVNFYPSTVEEMQKLLTYVIHSDFAHTPEFAAQALAGLQASGDAATAERVFAGLFASPRLEEVLPKVKAPTLVVWGREDRLFPVALAPYIAELVRGARVQVIDNASHFPQVDAPEAFNAAVAAFLAE